MEISNYKFERVNVFKFLQNMIKVGFCFEGVRFFFKRWLGKKKSRMWKWRGRGQKGCQVKKHEVDVLHTDKHESLLRVDCIVFNGFAQTCSNNYPGKFAISLWNLQIEVKNEVRDLTALTGSNITLTIYYTSNVLPPLILFLSQ